MIGKGPITVICSSDFAVDIGIPYVVLIYSICLFVWQLGEFEQNLMFEPMAIMTS